MDDKEGRVGWKYYEGKSVYLILKNKRQYAGKVIEIDDSKPPLIWITLIDKYDKRIVFVHSEIELMEEEELRK
jgi:hypothetical protein